MKMIRSKNIKIDEEDINPIFVSFLYIQPKRLPNPSFLNEIQDKFKDSEELRHCVMDLKNFRIMDSASIGILLALSCFLADRKGKLLILNFHVEAIKKIICNPDDNFFIICTEKNFFEKIRELS